MGCLTLENDCALERVELSSQNCEKILGVHANLKIVQGYRITENLGNLALEFKPYLSHKRHVLAQILHADKMGKVGLVLIYGGRRF